jgi:hypothetical protein
VAVLDRDSTYLQYIVMAKRVENQKLQHQPLKKRALYLSTEVIQKTKNYDKNKMAATFQMIAQKAGKLSNPLIAITHTIHKLSNATLPLVNNPGNTSIHSASVGPSPHKRDSKQSANTKDTEVVSQLENFMQMRKDIGQSLAKLSKFKRQFLGRITLQSS